jgi:ribonuclease BN (tRNA processing enzyme)
MVKIRILGCSGGIGAHMRTTSLLLDDDVLIDAGTGVGDLPLEALAKIDHIFLTHVHLDHIAALPLLLDSVIGLRTKPVTVHASVHVIDVLKQHIFNWMVWPNFNMIPDPATPFMVYDEIRLGESFDINGKTITALPANHVVPAMGYQVDSGDASFVYTGDTAGGMDFWKVVNKIDNLKYLMIETAFSNEDAEMAKLSKHLCPDTLAKELKQLKKSPEIFITHHKPGEDDRVMQQIAANVHTQHCMSIKPKQVFRL